MRQIVRVVRGIIGFAVLGVLLALRIALAAVLAVITPIVMPILALFSGGWVFHFTLTSASWINAVKNFFSVITRQRIRRGVFTSVANLQHAICDYIREHNRNPKPLVWTKPADTILAKLSRLPVPLD